ncbi:acyl-coenzyme A diphosphatase FITM2 [Parasteatoda tepidariorum]|uniref:acyl-coenzyme A diphosphatase FITM2 n=1 Tax=Parasteatoda tepidariorum TaxID=114398 RepID=UPI0039BD2A92
MNGYIFKTNMAGGKRKSSPKELNWQNFQAKRSQNVGKKPLPDPSSIKHVFLMIIMHVARKIVLFETELKIAIYLGALLCGSLVSDFTPIPKSYFSRRSNLFNYYFVKWGWAWTLLVVSIFLGLTSWIYCCGNIDKIKRHFYRLLVGTGVWFCFTKSFVLIESYTSYCSVDKYTSRALCIRNNHSWRGFDISGHAFLLIYCGLLIAEEAKAIRGWERIGELIRNFEFDDDSPLNPLEDEERQHLKENYEKITPYVRSAFLVLTYFSILWDVMLVCTILYFHSMIQKVIGGSLAILLWYATYKWWFKSWPGLPGQGSFKYYEQSSGRNSYS